MKSRTRKIIEKWVKGALKNPEYIGEGSVFIWPGKGIQSEHHLVCWIRYSYRGKLVEEFNCDCTPYWYSPDDTCEHVRDLKIQIAEEKEKMA